MWNKRTTLAFVPSRYTRPLTAIPANRGRVAPDTVLQPQLSDV